MPNRTGLIFPSTRLDGTGQPDFNFKGYPDGISFYFQGANLLPHAPATYIFRVNFVQQVSYYTIFFYANHWASGFSDPTAEPSYYGMDPYPVSPPNGNTQNWEISTEHVDFTGTDLVGYGTWYTQIVIVSKDVNDVLTFNYYYDVANGTTKKITHVDQNGPWTIGPSPILVWGDIPWNDFPCEALSGTLRGIQIYSTDLSLSDAVTESNNDTINTPQTTNGKNNIWYMSQNPTPSDISDKSGKGHNPIWLNAGTSLYTGSFFNNTSNMPTARVVVPENKKIKLNGSKMKLR